MKKISMFVLITYLLSIPAFAKEISKKVLVIISSESELLLKNGKLHKTGYYFNELTVPAKKLVDNGYELVFANPKGNKPEMDQGSFDVKYFNGNQKEFDDHKIFLEKITQLESPLKLKDVIKKGLDQYQGVFFPGGHAPMIDLLKNKEVGIILKHFHQKLKPTALICHGPIALVAATEKPETFIKNISSGKLKKQSWIYQGYNMTIFSTNEEKVAENAIGGEVYFYPESALKALGGNVKIGKEWNSNAIRDRELITGQNPFSDDEFSKLFLTALSEK